METKDEYILKIYENGKGAHYYYKNGKLHREAGSAILNPLEVKMYTDEPDKNLYRKEIVPDMSPNKTQGNDPFGLGIKTMYYSIAQLYLEGVRYNRPEFEKMVKILQEKRQLEAELNTNSEKPTKLKL